MPCRTLRIALLFTLTLLNSAHAGETGAAPAPKLDDGEIAKLIARLNAEDFEQREAATAELIKLGSANRAALELAQTKTDSPETRTRLKTVLKEYRYQNHAGAEAGGLRLALVPAATSVVSRRDATAKFTLRIWNISSELLEHELKAEVRWSDTVEEELAEQKEESTLDARLEIRVVKKLSGVMEKVSDMPAFESLDVGRIPRGECKTLGVRIQLSPDDSLNKGIDISGDSGRLLSTREFSSGEYDVTCTLRVLSGQAPAEATEAQKRDEFTVRSKPIHLTISAPPEADAAAEPAPNK